MTKNLRKAASKRSLAAIYNSDSGAATAHENNLKNLRNSSNTNLSVGHNNNNMNTGSPIIRVTSISRQPIPEPKKSSDLRTSSRLNVSSNSHSHSAYTTTDFSGFDDSFDSYTNYSGSTADTEQDKMAKADSFKEKADQVFAKGTDFLTAIDYYNRALRMCPQSSKNKRAELFASIGKSYLNLKQYKHVVDSCSKAIMMNPLNVEALLTRASANDTLDTWDSLYQAVQDYEVIAENSSEYTLDAQSHLNTIRPRMQEKQDIAQREIMMKLRQLLPETPQRPQKLSNKSSGILKMFTQN